MKLLIFGMGFSAQTLVEEMRPFEPGSIRGTTRTAEKAEALRAKGIEPMLFPGDDLAADLDWASHVLISAGPKDGVDPVLQELRGAFADAAPGLSWVGYLSTTGVYGHHGGEWVDETAPLTPATKRGQARVMTEAEWRALHESHGLPLHIFRLPGIYGPGRGPFAKVKAGTARRIIKPGQVFSRIHVEDIAQALLASMAAPDPGRIYNICDDDPAAPEDVLSYAAKLLGVDLPPPEDFETAEMSPMARSFYAESKKVSNARMKAELGVKLRYPTYQAGLDALYRSEFGTRTG